MAYRRPWAAPYSVSELTDADRSTCALLAWDMICRDPPSPDALEPLLAAANADEGFRKRLGSARLVRDIMLRHDAPASWDRLIEREIDKVADPRAREIIFAFLFDLSALGTVTTVESALLDRLRSTWGITELPSS